jgi:hypothetical protein
MAGNKKIVSGYHTDIHYVENTEAFILFFSKVLGKTGKVQHISILAGHYQVVFDEISNTLVPLIPEEYPKGTALQVRSKMYAGDYPFRSFLLGLDVLQYLWTHNYDAKILLLVNDRNIKRGNRLDLPLEQDSTNRLRRNYYHRTQVLPKVFEKTCSERQMAVQDVFVTNKDARDTPGGILPKDTIFFSEQVLMRRFKSYTLRKRLEEKQFIISETEGAKNVIYPARTPFTGDYCVLGAKQSSCISVAIELISLMVEMGASHMILAIPNDCLAPINEAAEIVLSIYKKELSIFVLSNLESQAFSSSMKCTWHKYLPNHEKQISEHSAELPGRI